MRFDAVVVGGGAIGCSTAFHLADAGLDVALVERNQIASQNSPRAAGLAVQVRTNFHFSEIARRSVEILVGFEARTGIPLDVHQTGSVAIGRTPEAAERVRAHVPLGARNGVDVELIDAETARKLVPWADATAAEAISYTRTDLYLEPGDLPRAYVAAARARAARVMECTLVERVEIASGGVAGVATRDGVIHADRIAVCAGPWTAPLVADVGLELPVETVRHALMVTEPARDIRSQDAAFRVVDANVYARPCGGGLMFGGYEADPWFTSTGRADTVDALRLDFAVIEELMGRVADALPALRALRPGALRGGLPTLTPDGLFLIDTVPGVDGLFFATGCNVGGLSTAPAVGEDLARWIATGDRPKDLEPFSAGRFHEGGLATLRAEARARYTATEFG